MIISNDLLQTSNLYKDFVRAVHHSNLDIHRRSAHKYPIQGSVMRPALLPQNPVIFIQPFTCLSDPLTHLTRSQPLPSSALSPRVHVPPKPQIIGECPLAAALTCAIDEIAVSSENGPSSIGQRVWCPARRPTHMDYVQEGKGMVSRKMVIGGRQEGPERRDEIPQGVGLDLGLER